MLKRLSGLALLILVGTLLVACGTKEVIGEVGSSQPTSEVVSSNVESSEPVSSEQASSEITSSGTQVQSSGTESTLTPPADTSNAQLVKDIQAWNTAQKYYYTNADGSLSYPSLIPWEDLTPTNAPTAFPVLKGYTHQNYVECDPTLNADQKSTVIEQNRGGTYWNGNVDPNVGKTDGEIAEEEGQGQTWEEQHPGGQDINKLPPPTGTGDDYEGIFDDFDWDAAMNGG